MKNPILDELYQIRSQILAEHEADLREYLHAEFERAKAAGHPVANIQQRSIHFDESKSSDNSNVESLSSSPSK